MDDDLKTYLIEMEQRTAALVAGAEERTTSLITTEIRKSEERTAQTMTSEIRNLHTEMQNVEKRLEARFDTIDARLKLQAGLIQSGARALARFSEFSENSEARWIALVSRVEALERKVTSGDHGNGTGKN